jgi:peroxiredoxin (alkyl hydroperoxide reductase subunit C)
MSVEIGQEAPDFELKASTGDTISLSSFRGEKAVALVFYPFTFTGVCHGELCELRDDLSRYESAGVQVLAISCDTVHAQKRWAAEEGYNFPVLSDFWPHGAVAQAYGVFNDVAGIANRGTFVIDKAGVVRFAEMNMPGEARDQQGWRKALADAVAA